MHANVQQLNEYYYLVRGRRGIFVANRNDAYIGRALIEYGEFSESEWHLLSRFCEPGSVIAEIGANIGAHTVSIAGAVGPKGRVIAVEPQSVIFQNLCTNLLLNLLHNTQVHHCGCGETQASVNIPAYDYGAPGNFGGIPLDFSSAQGSPVPVLPFDDLFHESRLDLVKIDVEGMEADVIRGARRAIESYKPVLYVENDRTQESRELIVLIQSLGYRLWWHFPYLFNPQNFFDNKVNIYGSTASFNMLCAHATSALDTKGLQEITDSGSHPLLRR